MNKPATITFIKRAMENHFGLRPNALDSRQEAEGLSARLARGFVALNLEACGMSRKEIAEEFGFTRQAVDYMIHRAKDFRDMPTPPSILNPPKTNQKKT